MPVFDFKNTPDDKKKSECTYTTFRSSESEASANHPIMILDNSDRKWKHHSSGVFTNPNTKTAFEFNEEDGTVSGPPLHLPVQQHGQNQCDDDGKRYFHDGVFEGIKQRLPYLRVC